MNHDIYIFICPKIKKFTMDNFFSLDACSGPMCLTIMVKERQSKIMLPILLKNVFCVQVAILVAELHYNPPDVYGFTSMASSPSHRCQPQGGFRQRHQLRGEDAKTAKKVSLDAENGLTDAKHSRPTSILSEL